MRAWLFFSFGAVIAGKSSSEKKCIPARRSKTSYTLVLPGFSGLILRRNLQSFCHPDQLGQRLCAHFIHNAAAMNLDRDLADAQIGGDLLVKQAGDNQTHYFSLARCQRFETLAQFRSFLGVLARSAV